MILDLTSLLSTLGFANTACSYEQPTPLEQIVTARKIYKFDGLSQKNPTVQQTVQWVLSGKLTFLSAHLRALILN